MTRRDRDDDPFDDIFRQVDEMMNRMIDEMFDQSRRGNERGFSSPSSAPNDSRRSAGHSNVHVDIMQDDDNGRLHVVADLPGVKKEDIRLNATESELRIKADGSARDRSYDERIELPTRVDPDSADANYNNGVLEVIFDEKGGGGRNIDIS
ncbi:MAG: Hsp20/alpha crystallin family protein [Halobacteria archaeon]|nr:Hsp20/alpha crystallin family protein [Halobacteria archaeon]